MKPIRLGIISQDQVYVERFMAYIRGSAFRHQVTPVWYTEAEGFLERYSGQEPLDLILADLPADPGLMGWERTHKGCRLLWLTDGEAGDDSVNHGENEVSRSCLDKFQPLNVLLEEMIRLSGVGILPQELSGSSGRRGRSRILTVYSAVGGAGKTLFTQAAAAVLVRMGYRPVLLTLESIPSPCWTRGRQVEEDGFGRVLYHARAAPHSSPMQILHHLREDLAGKVRVLPPAPSAMELRHMEEDDVNKLLRLLALPELGDIVLVDLDSSLHPRTIGAMRASDHIVCLVPDDGISVHKTERLLHEMGEGGGDESGTQDLIRRMSVLMNRSSVPPRSDISLLSSNVEDVLPLEKDWLHLSSMDLLQHRTAYHDRVQRWLSRLLHPAEAERQPTGKGALA